MRLGMIAAPAAALAFASVGTACDKTRLPIDAPNFGETCVPSGSFALANRFAVQGILNVHVDSSGLVEVDTTAELLLALDVVQTGTTVALTATPCAIHIPDIPLAGQDQPIEFQVPDATLASVGAVTGTATLSDPAATCANITSQPITLVLGARLDPATIATAPLPAAGSDGTFPTCAPSPTTTCALATGTGCACDQEGDGNPGATLIAHNVPAIDLNEVFVALRTTFTLTGQVWTSQSIKGEIDATLGQGILACSLTDGTACSTSDVTAVATLNPVITPQPGNPSTFSAVQVDPDTTCAEIVMTESTLFPQ